MLRHPIFTIGQVTSTQCSLSPGHALLFSDYQMTREVHLQVYISVLLFCPPNRFHDTHLVPHQTLLRCLHS